MIARRRLVVPSLVVWAALALPAAVARAQEPPPPPVARAQTPPSPPVVVAPLPAAAVARAQTSPPPPLVVSPPPPPASVTAPAAPSLRLALQTEGAVGVGTGAFYNHLVGGRLDLRFSDRVSLGGYLGYVNLKGMNGRAHSALTYAQLEYLAGDPAATIRYPLRFASGYLGGNGPVVRAAAGFAFALGPKVDLVTEVLAPMVWLSNNQTLLSLDLALELDVRL
jgi:hypothetical protein